MGWSGTFAARALNTLIRVQPGVHPATQFETSHSAVIDDHRQQGDNERGMSPIRAFSLLILVLLATVRVPAQDAPHRLILKDGSYQLVTKYEVKGDRVHYYSSEREEWEELPNSLVDWPATDKFEKDRTATAPEAVQLDKELEEERQLEESQLPQVAPGLRIPEPTGVFLLDNFQSEPQLVELNQSAGDVNRNTKGNILRGALNPIASQKQTIELEGAHAAIQSHVGVPTLYINIDEGPEHPATGDSERPPQPAQPQQPEKAIVPFDRFRILKVEVKGNKRVLGDIKRQVTGKMSQEQHAVKATTSGLRGGWLKVTPTEPLAPGEYALVEMGEKEAMNLYVWDFGVNPKAPANPNPWKPDGKTGTAQTPKPTTPK